MLKCELDGMLAKECAVKCELANRVIRSETKDPLLSLKEMLARLDLASSQGLSCRAVSLEG